jgi:phage terminase large subunit-like protein
MTQRKTTQYATRATKYAQEVCDGSILACKWVRLACQRHLDDLQKRDYRWTFDFKRANAICVFAESMRHEKGSLQGQRLRLEDWQVFVLASVFGWVDKDTCIRKYREAFILCPRGNGKSPIAAIVALWMSFFDGEKGSEVYCGATTEKQAWEVFRPARAFVEQEPALQRTGIVAAAKSIYTESTRSRFAPVIGKPGDGASVYCAILDEWHEADDAVQYDTFKTGANKRPNSLLLVISTAGVTTEGPCYQKQKDVEQVLEGVIDNERLFGIVYTIDEETDWTSREALVMANPNLGVSNDEEALLLDQTEAVRNPAKQNIFKTKHLNVWCTALSGWMNMQAWAKCYDPELAEKIKGLPCWHGSDLASKIDLSATSRLFRDDSEAKPHYYCLTRAYLPEERVNLPENQHYQAWVRQGWLTATPGSSMDYATIEADALAEIEQYKIRELAYDERYADQYSQRVSEQSGIPRVVVKPNPSELSPAMKELEAAVYDGRFHHDNNPLLTWCMGSVLSREVKSTGNLSMPDKERPENKLDAAIALFIAMSRAMRCEVTADPGYGLIFF